MAARFSLGFVDSVWCDDSCTADEKSIHCAQGSASVAKTSPCAHLARHEAVRPKARAIRAQCSGVAL
eukprot:scaffold19179_cov35-Tisochrysis_lutea.AAC.2